MLFPCLQSGRATALSSSSSSAPASSSSSATAAPVTQTLEQSFAHQAAWAPTSKKAQDLNKALGYWIARDMMAFQVVERPGFVRLMKVAVPHYKVPSRNFFSKTEIPHLYNKVRADVEKSLAQGDFF